MHLYTYFRSSASYRVRIALNVKGLVWEPVFVNLPANMQRGTDYLAANPQGLIPALAVDGAIIPQSLAIIEYLEELHPSPALLPKDPLSRAQARGMAQAIACDIHPLNNLRVLKYLKAPLGHDQQTIDDWYRHWISIGFEALEALVNRYGSEHYCYGETLSLADICLAPQMWNARRFQTDLSAFPRLTAIDAHLTEIDAFRRAAPENQDDFTA